MVKLYPRGPEQETERISLICARTPDFAFGDTSLNQRHLSLQNKKKLLHPLFFNDCQVHVPLTNLIELEQNSPCLIPSASQ
ncbi:hypothetical protein chiPu_0004228 [Chiloscyllium punctatum]|uniref:Uncharacterized protein n=1 Tax=Chiloscyllium punctatum TaxID=137246 RepID=A0A401S613_CHIPU|nr:hypothetical protein [Chiloscyllium punctatum]